MLPTTTYRLLAAVLALGLAGLASRSSSADEPPNLMLEEAVIDAVRLVNPRPNDVLYPVNINNWWGHMNRRGDLVLFPRFDWTDYAYEGRIRAVRHGQTGFIDGSGRWLVNPTFPYADRYADGYAVVSDGKRFGYLDKRGEFFLPIELDGALRFQEGFAAVQQGDRIGFVDRRGELVIPLRFARARSFASGLAMVQLPDRGRAPGLLGYIDKRGEFAFLDTEEQFTDLGDFIDGMAMARVGQKWGYIDRSFRLRIEPQFDEAGDFHNGVAPVQFEGRWGYIDKTGRFAVPPHYDHATEFADGFGMVVHDEMHGYVNRVGDEIIPLEFKWAEPFVHNLGRVSQSPSFGYVDAAVRPVWDPRAPLRAIRDRTIREDARIRTQHRPRRHRLVSAPPYREPVPDAAYPPDYLYEPELPRPPVP